MLVTERTGVVSGRHLGMGNVHADGVDHAVIDEAIAAGLAAKRGMFLALVRRGVVTAAMITTRTRCARCRAVTRSSLAEMVDGLVGQPCNLCPAADTITRLNRSYRRPCDGFSARSLPNLVERAFWVPVTG